MLAHALRRLQAESGDLIFLSHQAFDLTLPVLMEHQLKKVQPQAVINTAAYNLVKQCEQSWAINATGPDVPAKLCARQNVPLVHYSTDYVLTTPSTRNHVPKMGFNVSHTDFITQRHLFTSFPPQSRQKLPAA